MRRGGVKFKEAERVLLHNGFEKSTTNGSHHKYKRGSEYVIISFPVVNVMIWRRLNKEYNLNNK